MTKSPVSIRWGSAILATSADHPATEAFTAIVEPYKLKGWWDAAPDDTRVIDHWTGDGSTYGILRRKGRTVEIGGVVHAADAGALAAAKRLFGSQRIATLSVDDGGFATESDVRLVSLKWDDLNLSNSRFSLTLLADDPLRYGSVVPVVVNRVPNPWALPGGVEWGVSAGSGHGTVLSYEPGPPTALRRTFTTSSSAEVYMMPYDSGTSGVWVTAGAWLGVGAWMRRSDGEHVVGTISWRKPDGTFLSWAPFRYTKPLPYEWTWVSLAAQVPEGAGYARPAFGVRSAASVTPGSWFEVTGAVTTVGRLAPGPVGVV